MVKCLGIYRELQNSPNREGDDALILKATMAQLELLNVRTELLEPEAADREDLSAWDMIVPMCESYPRLMRLQRVPPETLIVNPPSAVLGCYRTRMMEAFARAPGLRVPPTETRPVAGAASWAPPPFLDGGGLWVKRGDVHNTCDRDVVFARDMAAVESVRRDFERREISFLLLQRHVDGDLIKFYGVGPGQWFTWFYHDPQSARRLPFELGTLVAQGELAAGAVGLEVFGGDAIVAPDGEVCVIDINSWPSFARVRAEASVQIARRLALRLKERQAAREGGSR